MLTHEKTGSALTQELFAANQVNFVDVLTSNNTNLQISFVHSRYRNENVAICVCVNIGNARQNGSAAGDGAGGGTGTKPV